MSKICHSSFVFTPISMISGTVVSLLTQNQSQLPTIRKKEVFRLPLLGAQWDSSLKLSDFVDYEPVDSVHHSTQKKQPLAKLLFWVPSGILR